MVVAGTLALAALLLFLPPFGGAAPASAAMGPGSNCTRSCGDIDIPYPFGVEPGCYHAAGFNLNLSPACALPRRWHSAGARDFCCQRYGTHRQPHRASEDGRPLLDARSRGSDMAMNGTWGGGLPKDGPFFLSESTNILKAIRCNFQVDLLGGMEGRFGFRRLVGSCTAICPQSSPLDRRRPATLQRKQCAGTGCCKAEITLGYPSYIIQVYPETSRSVNSYGLPDSGIYIVDGEDEKTATLDWIIGNSSCPTNTSAPECRSANSLCRDYEANSGTYGYLCQCRHGYEGNPYILDGCQGGLEIWYEQLTPYALAKLPWTLQSAFSIVQQMCPPDPIGPLPPSPSPPLLASRRCYLVPHGWIHPVGGSASILDITQWRGNVVKLHAVAQSHLWRQDHHEHMELERADAAALVPLGVPRQRTADRGEDLCRWPVEELQLGQAYFLLLAHLFYSILSAVLAIIFQVGANMVAMERKVENARPTMLRGGEWLENEYEKLVHYGKSCWWAPKLEPIEKVVVVVSPSSSASRAVPALCLCLCSNDWFCSLLLGKQVLLQ
ncbi:hypothetical protein PR202_gb02761 [Eleusine coracana subsp. coracana]|uniref:Wall-associated receptor kinase galacturonan-binding domain-containing protein n=1 Tax=Eleusine coracana subsp. coracana TaxID=191504 RepID=A0AAV5DZZ8_ELECO|nr:hypothetical protein PR202_gb02761 [Eleusine coracana subsp. coracana]